jgi:hypothetical protein
MNTPQHKRSLYSLATMTAYLKGELAEDTVQRVDALLAEDANYAEAMEALDREQMADPEKALANRDEFEKYLRKMLEAQMQPQKTPGQEDAETPVRRFSPRRWLAVAAVVLLLLTPLLYQWLRPTATVEQMAMAHLDAFAFSGTKGPSPTIDSLLAATLVVYEQGRLEFQEHKELYRDSLPAALKTAKRGFGMVLAQPRDSLGVREYLQAELGLGVCMLLEGYPAEAERHLLAVQDHGNNEWTMDAAWYLAWTDLLLGRKNAAIDGFFKLSRQKGLYMKKAQYILDELE